MRTCPSCGVALLEDGTVAGEPHAASCRATFLVVAVTERGRWEFRPASGQRWPTYEQASAALTTNRRIATRRAQWSIEMEGQPVKTVNEYAGEVLAMVDDAIAEGVIPADVTNYSDLHSYVDANEFLLAAEVPWGADIPEGEDPNGVWVDVELEVQRRLRERVHAQCTADDHDREVPDTADPQATTPDGLRACNDCGEPMYYCRKTQWYHHVDASVVCYGWRG